MSASQYVQTHHTLILRPRLAIVTCAFLVALLAASNPLRAVITIWDGGGANTNWSTSANWNTNVVPLSTHDVEFATGFGSGTTIETAGDRTANSIIISTGTTFTLSGDTLGQD